LWIVLGIVEFVAFVTRARRVAIAVALWVADASSVIDLDAVFSHFLVLALQVGAVHCEIHWQHAVVVYVNRAEEVHRRDGRSRDCEQCVERGREGEGDRRERASGESKGDTGMLVFGSSRGLWKEGEGEEFHRCV
jgi:hypothetical protein